MNNNNNNNNNNVIYQTLQTFNTMQQRPDSRLLYYLIREIKREAELIIQRFRFLKTKTNKKDFFIYHCLSVVLRFCKNVSRVSNLVPHAQSTITVISGRGLPAKSAHIVYCYIKFAFFLAIYMFGSSFRTLVVILVSD